MVYDALKVMSTRREQNELKDKTAHLCFRANRFPFLIHDLSQRNCLLGDICTSSSFSFSFSLCFLLLRLLFLLFLSFPFFPSFTFFHSPFTSCKGLSSLRGALACLATLSDPFGCQCNVSSFVLFYSYVCLSIYFVVSYVCLSL